MTRTERASASLGFVLLVASVALLLASDWRLGCRQDADPQGEGLSGIDCLQYWTPPKSETGIAHVVGFYGLVALAVFGLGVAAAAVLRGRRRLSHRRSGSRCGA